MGRRGAACILFGLALGAVCASGTAQEPLRQAPLPTFDATQLSPDRYTVVGRLWVDSWRTAFDVPMHADSSAALAQLSDEATRRGADALTNVVCLNDERGYKTGYFCYALAVKLR
jgi:hypothetical protein